MAAGGLPASPHRRVKVGLTVLMPSMGRVWLEEAVRSCAGADEVIVLFDGPDAAERAKHVEMPEWVRTVVMDEHMDTCGGWQRTVGMRLARYSHLAFMDDDDAFVPGGVDAIRAGVHLDKLCIFRVAHTGSTVWAQPGLHPGNVSGLGFVVPNRPGLPAWPSVRGSDFLFAEECARVFGDVVWRETVIAQCVRSGSGRLGGD